jgi:hypothetical protein
MSAFNPERHLTLTEDTLRQPQPTTPAAHPIANREEPAALRRPRAEGPTVPSERIK